MRNKRFICSGPPGSGKTSVLDDLSRDFAVVSEPARRVLASQRAIGGAGTSEQDPALFVALMLETARRDLDELPESPQPVLFDRAIPDLLAYASYYNLPDLEILRALAPQTYANPVFWFPAWEDVYTQDDERTLDFEAAKDFGVLIFDAYSRLGYQLIDVPRGPIASRADFIRECVDQLPPRTC